MKRLISMAMFTGCLLPIPAHIRAQDCSNLTNYDLRGTYTMSGSGYADLSKMLQGVPGVPAGLVPISWVGAHTYDGVGSGTGWVTLVAGGTQMTAKLTDMKYSINPDCSLLASFSLQVNELQGIKIGPFSRVQVVVQKASGMWWMPLGLEIHMIFAGTAPGTPAGAGVDSGIAYRISMQH